MVECWSLVYFVLSMYEISANCPCLSSLITGVPFWVSIGIGKSSPCSCTHSFAASPVSVLGACVPSVAILSSWYFMSPSSFFFLSSHSLSSRILPLASCIRRLRSFSNSNFHSSSFLKSPFSSLITLYL